MKAYASECRWCRSSVEDGARLDEDGYCLDQPCWEDARDDRRAAMGDARRDTQWER